MFLGDEHISDEFHELRIPDMDLFSSCSFPPMSPQVSAEALFLQKEKKEEEWRKCKKISGGVLWGPCSCDACERHPSPKRSLSPSDCFDKINFLFPSQPELVLKKSYFNNDSEDFHEDLFVPDMSYFDQDEDAFEYDEVLTIPSRFRKRVTKRPRDNRDDDLFDLDDYDYRPSFSHKGKKKKKSHISAGRLKYQEDAQRRSFNIMSLYEKGNRSRSETGYLGVRISTSGRRFRATVNYLGKPRNVGTFDTPEEAAMEYDKKLLELSDWKIDRNRLNFCDRWDLRARKLITGRPKKRRKLPSMGRF